MHIIFFNLELIHLVWNIQIALLLIKKITILAKYLHLLNIFSKISAINIPKYSSLNENIINLEKYKWLSDKPISNFIFIELENSITSIKTNLANNFIRLFKSFAKDLILVVKILDDSFCLPIDYQSLNNLIIKS